MIIRTLYTALDHEFKLPLLMIFMEEFCVLILMCLVNNFLWTRWKKFTEHILLSVELIFFSFDTNKTDFSRCLF